MAVERLQRANGDWVDVEFDDETPDEPAVDKSKLSAEENVALRQAETRAKKAEKALAFLMAGIDPDSPKAKWFVKGYDGKVEPDAIKAAALEAGIIAPEAPPEPDPDTAEGIAAAARIAQAGNGANPHTPLGTEALDQAFAEGMAAGGPKAAQAAMLNKARELGFHVVGPQ